MTEFESTWSVDTRNIVYADEGDPLDLYRTIIRKILGVSRQTVWQRVKRGELQAVHVRRGKRKGLRIKVLDQQPALFDNV